MYVFGWTTVSELCRCSWAASADRMPAPPTHANRTTPPSPGPAQRPDPTRITDSSGSCDRRQKRTLTLTVPLRDVRPHGEDFRNFGKFSFSFRNRRSPSVFPPEPHICDTAESSAARASLFFFFFFNLPSPAELFLSEKEPVCRLARQLGHYLRD